VDVYKVSRRCPVTNSEQRLSKVFQGSYGSIPGSATSYALKYYNDEGA
jgi:hypothetical protein